MDSRATCRRPMSYDSVACVVCRYQARIVPRHLVTKRWGAPVVCKLRATPLAPPLKALDASNEVIDTSTRHPAVPSPLTTANVGVVKQILFDTQESLVSYTGFLLTPWDRLSLRTPAHRRLFRHHNCHLKQEEVEREHKREREHGQ